MIKLNRVTKEQINIMFAACQKMYDILKIFTETLPDEQHKINLSITQSLGMDLFDRKAKFHKQDHFSLNLKMHEVLILIKSLQQFERETQNTDEKNMALKLINHIHPQTV